MTKMGFAEGGCACSAVRYRMTAPPIFVHCCHCTWCQRESGSAFAVNALIEASEVALLKGQAVRVSVPTASGRGQTFTRCPACSVGLWSNYSGAGERINFIRVGTLDDPSLAPPDIHIYTSSMQPWVTLPNEAVAKTGYYKRDAHWPADSIRRYDAARAA